MEKRKKITRIIAIIATVFAGIFAVILSVSFYFPDNIPIMVITIASGAIGLGLFIVVMVLKKQPKPNLPGTDLEEPPQPFDEK